jgi:hypothetical protein
LGSERDPPKRRYKKKPHLKKIATMLAEEELEIGQEPAPPLSEVEKVVRKSLDELQLREGRLTRDSVEPAKVVIKPDQLQVERKSPDELQVTENVGLRVDSIETKNLVIGEITVRHGTPTSRSLISEIREWWAT